MQQRTPVPAVQYIRTCFSSAAIFPKAVSCTSLLQVYVTDVNDHRPSINIEALSPVEGHATTPEAAAVGSFVAHVIVADADAGANGRVSCQLDGTESQLFRLHSVSAIQAS